MFGRSLAVAAVALLCAVAMASTVLAAPAFPAAARAAARRTAPSTFVPTPTASAGSRLHRSATPRRAQSYGAAVTRGAQQDPLLATMSSSASASGAAAPAGRAVRDGVPTFPYGWETKYYTQRLDHFNFQNNDVFQQKYLVNDSFWDGSGPIFFYTGNEGPIELFANNTGFMWEVAAEFNALIVFTEHRYYGTTLPFGHNSFTAHNLQWLSAEQALADYAEFLTWFKASYGLDHTTRIVAFGGSYGGMLAAWFRIKYPAIVAGAISASAPILQFQEAVSPYAFNNAVTADFAKSDPTCAAAIKSSWDILRGMSPAAVSAAFQFCPNQYTQRSRLEADVFAWISNAIVYMAMVDYPYPTSFLGPMPGYPVTAACSYLTGTSGAAIIPALAQAMTVFYNYTGEAGSCYNITSEDQGPSTLSDPGGWAYQSCTEMVMPMAQGGPDDFFWSVPWNYTAYAAGCFASYGLWPRPMWALQSFGGALFSGGIDMKADSNIVFSNGQLDPWMPGGVNQNLSMDSNLVAYNYFGAHHLDLRASDPLDPQSVIDCRNFHRYYIGVFLGQNSGGLTNAQAAGITILITIVVSAVSFWAYKNHLAAEKAAKAHPEQHPDAYAPADVAPNAHKPTTATAGVTGAVVSFDSPQHTPAAVVGSGPHRLSLQH